jgi:hypothetical protein
MKTPIDKLNELLESENSWDQIPIEILPNGEIRRVGDHSSAEIKPSMRPLTFRENLGGEYAAC